MSITQITPKEQALTATLRRSTEMLNEVVKERDAQRKVLEQALEALKEPIGFTGCRQIDVKLKAAITAIQEQLK